MRLLVVTAAIFASLAALAVPPAAAWSLADRDGDKVFDALERQLSRADASDSVDVIVTLRADGRTSERIRILSGSRVLRTIYTRLSAREAGRSYYVFWRAPRQPVRLRFCVKAWDAERNASAPSCASLRVR